MVTSCRGAGLGYLCVPSTPVGYFGKVSCRNWCVQRHRASSPLVPISSFHDLAWSEETKARRRDRQREIEREGDRVTDREKHREEETRKLCGPRPEKCLLVGGMMEGRKYHSGQSPRLAGCLRLSPPFNLFCGPPCPLPAVIASLGLSFSPKFQVVSQKGIRVRSPVFPQGPTDTPRSCLWLRSQRSRTERARR